ncbi:MAG TPA: alpha/beta fold hydrolase [Chloroflexota bacterium]
MPEQEVSYCSEDGTPLSATWQAAAGKLAVLLAHGITGEREEGGLFAELAARLAGRGISSLRFDYRAHGRSGGTQEQMTIAGETSDVRAGAAWLRAQGYAPAAIVAASFGAVSACEYVGGDAEVRCLVLLNPVLDLLKTFLEPVCPWPRASFNAPGFAHLERHGFLWLDGHFKIGRALVEEMRRAAPGERLKGLDIPVLTLHGDADGCVPYEVARELGAPNPRSRFVTVPGADHGFGRPHEREQVVQAALDWLLANLSN